MIKWTKERILLESRADWIDVLKGIGIILVVMHQIGVSGDFLLI